MASWLDDVWLLQNCAHPPLLGAGYAANRRGAHYGYVEWLLTCALQSGALHVQLQVALQVQSLEVQHFKGTLSGPWSAHSQVQYSRQVALTRVALQRHL